jgi:thiosulfate dehydrogenase (quinone) large subunit
MQATGTLRRAPGFRNPRPLMAFLTEPWAAPFWFILRLFIGWQWLSSGLHKLHGPGSAGWVRDGEVNGKFMNGGDTILQFWQKAAAPPNTPNPPVAYDWYRSFLTYMIDHQWQGWFAWLIALGETLVGLALIIGAFTALAALGGMVMNFNYMLAGSAGLNPVLFAGGALLLLGWRIAGYVGLDRWLLPLLGTPWQPGRAFRRTEASAPPLVPAPLPVPPKRRYPTPAHGGLLARTQRDRRAAHAARR